MINSFLPSREYSFYDAMTWGNCLKHAERAWLSSSLGGRVVHATVALMEATPLIGQIVSLFEMAMAYFFISTHFPDLAKGTEYPLNKGEEPFLLHRVKEIKPSENVEESIEFKFPSDLNDLYRALFPLHRKIDQQYQDLPWPSNVKKVVLLNWLKGGNGDLTAAAKVIAVMQKISPELTFDWCVISDRGGNYDVEQFARAHSLDPTRVNIRWSGPRPQDKEPGDLLIIGPAQANSEDDLPYMERKLGRKINGPIFSFVENGYGVPYWHPYKGYIPLPATWDSKAQKIFFPPKQWKLPMGLQAGSGVFLDKVRIEAPLSRGYYCPSYLNQLEDASLREDILAVMPNDDDHSFNSGYAHNPASWRNFIQCAALHEKRKHVVIVLNYRGNNLIYSAEDFKEVVFSKQLYALLKKKGYGAILFKSEKGGELLQDTLNPESERRLTVIVRPSFKPNDMKNIQLASERLLATGDNSAVEALCARCKLYLYEGYTHKQDFLKQQVELANQFSHDLGRLLILFGGPQREGARLAFSLKELDEVEAILNQPGISDATLQLCDRVASDYSFSNPLVAGLKRTVWHQTITELAEVEKEALGDQFGEYILSYGRKGSGVVNLPELGKRVSAAVQLHPSQQAV